jgi:hypothetical protein
MKYCAKYCASVVVNCSDPYDDYHFCGIGIPAKILCKMKKIVWQGTEVGVFPLRLINRIP